jgi:hypothetical protein
MRIADEIRSEPHENATLSSVAANLTDAVRSGFTKQVAAMRIQAGRLSKRDKRLP